MTSPMVTFTARARELAELRENTRWVFTSDSTQRGNRHTSVVRRSSERPRPPSAAWSNEAPAGTVSATTSTS